MISEWIASGGKVWELIEPVDGFHPTQISDALSVSVLWKLLQQQNLVPPMNPFNAQIEKMFGNQGGYTP